MSACGAKRCSEQPLQVWAFRYGIGEFAVARRHRSHVINRILSESRSPPCGCALLFQMHLSRIAQVTPPCNKKRRAQLSVRPAESAVGDEVRPAESADGANGGEAGSAVGDRRWRPPRCQSRQRCPTEIVPEVLSDAIIPEPPCRFCRKEIVYLATECERCLAGPFHLHCRRLHIEYQCTSPPRPHPFFFSWADTN